MARRRIAKKQKATKSELREESRKCAGLKIFEEQESLIQEMSVLNMLSRIMYANSYQYQAEYRHQSFLAAAL